MGRLTKHRGKIFKWTAAAAGLILAAAMLAGLVFYENNTSPERRHIIFIPKIIDEENDFWVQLLEGARMAAMENDLDITIVAPETENDYLKQNELVAWAVEQHPDAIVFTPSSYENSASAARLVADSRIPLVLVDSDVEGGYENAIVATDNVEAGKVQGEFMSRFLDENSRIALVCHVQGSSTALEREQGVREGLGSFEEQIVDVVYCDSDYDKAYDLMQEVIGRHPDINMVAGLNEYSAVGAARAILDAGLRKQVQMVGFDCSLEEIQLLEEGVFEAIVIQNPYKMGYLGVETAVRILNGEKVEPEIDSDCKLITKEEVFTEENQKILFMFTEE